MLKKPLSFEEQVDQLEGHNIKTDGFENVAELLAHINYYRLSGCALSFRTSASNSDCLPGTTLENICTLYYFDEELRQILRKYLEIAEVYYKTQIAHWFSLSKCINPPHDQHYDRNNYYRQDSFDEIIKSFERERDNYYKDSLIVKHHRSKYGGLMPLWVMLELLSFSNASKLYSSMYVSEQDLIASHIGISSKKLRNHLHCLSVLRNKCAHAARLYNTKLYPSVSFGADFLRKNPSVQGDSVFAYILLLLRRLPNTTYKTQLFTDICALIDKYFESLEFELIGFPDSYKQILLNSII